MIIIFVEWILCNKCLYFKRFQLLPAAGDNVPGLIWPEGLQFDTSRSSTN